MNSQDHSLYIFIPGKEDNIQVSKVSSRLRLGEAKQYVPEVRGLEPGEITENPVGSNRN